MSEVNLEGVLRAAWPWTAAFMRQLHELRPKPFQGSHLLFGSDYSGSHAGSRFRVYGFVIADADASPAWPYRCREMRLAFLKDGRRMSFKNLNDVHRQRALIPFLEASECIEGHVIAVAVTKKLGYLSAHRGALDSWQSLSPLSARWNVKAFEEMARVAHFFSLFLSAWSSPGVHISWLTDEDDIVANAGRLEDAHQFAARISGIYVPHRLGEFMMNTPAVVGNQPEFEDFLAIPDLAAGMIGEVLALRSDNGVRMPGGGGPGQLSQKADIIADWFWHNDGSLKKTCIIIDSAAKNKFAIGQMRMALQKPLDIFYSRPSGSDDST